MATKLLKTLWECEYFHLTTTHSRYTLTKSKKLNAVYNVKTDWRTVRKNQRQQFLEVNSDVHDLKCFHI